MSSKNSEVDNDNDSQCESKPVHFSNLRSKKSLERERRKKLVKFNAVTEIKELSEDSADSKLNLMEVDAKDKGNVSGTSPNTSTINKQCEAKDADTNDSFHSKRRNHYKNEFTASKQSEKSD